jgi:AcrR family transcriptional regulator
MNHNVDKPAATPDLILDTAEAAFAEHGFNGVSLRDITAKAGVNLAAVNYHFRNKENLYAEVIRRRIRPVNELRLRNLDRAVARAGPQPPPLAEIIDLMVRPVFDLHRDPSRGGPHIVRIIARSMTEPLPFLDELVAAEFHPVLARFTQVIRRHVAHLPPEDFMWRMNFMIGAMQHTLATLHQMGPLTRGICRSNDYEGALARFIAASLAILTAPVRFPPES